MLTNLYGHPRRYPDIKNEPTKELDECFIVETVSWIFSGVEIKTGNAFNFATSSGERERQYRRELADKYNFD